MNQKLINDLEAWADKIENGEKLITPDEMNCASLIRFAAQELTNIQSCDIEIDEWNALTDKQKLVLIRHAPDWTVLELIEEVEQMLKGNNK